jgi:hypothetical protein
MRDGRTSPAFVARAYKLRALPITCREPGRALPANWHNRNDLPEDVDPGAVQAAADLASGLVRLLDRDLARNAAKAPEPAAA